jgi:tol-pal system protein YbgF
MQREFFRWVVAASALWLASCADQGAFNGAPDNLSPAERRLQAVEDRVATLQRRVGNIETSRDSSALQTDLRQLRGEVEQLQHQMTVDAQQQKDQLANLESRVQRLEQGGGQAAAAAGSPSMGGGAPPALPPPQSVPPAGQAPAGNVSADEEQSYLRNFNMLRAGKNADAIAGFRQQLATYPQGSYADNGWYWMGMAYYNDHDDAQALSSFQSLLERFSASPRVPDTLLKVGAILQAESKPEQARAAYQRVIQSFPNTTAASTARQRLNQLK